MKFTICHAIPGRIRLRIGALRAASPLADSLLAWLRAEDWVKSARINHECASLVVEYDIAQQQTLDEMLELLAELSLDAAAALLQSLPAKPEPEIAENSRGAYKPPRQQWPLALPSLSMALAFSTNPALVALNVPLMLYCGLPIFRRAWHVWSTERRFNVDFLDTLAIGASLLQGNMVAGGAITWLIRLGDWIRDLTAAGSKRAASELLEFQSKTAWVLRNGDIVSIPASELKIDDAVVIYPGEMVPVDGEIVDGQALLDQKTITGEGLPVPRGVGENVYAASIVSQGQLTVRAQRVGDQTTAGQIARLTDSAPLGETRIQNHAELLADQLVLPTIGLAAGTAALTADFERFLNLVIVDYGTGIRVAAPTTVLASMTRAARAGIIIKSGAHLEKLCGVDTIIFDKTGTLSHGAPNVVDVLSYNPHISCDHLLSLAVAAETNFTHPVANALRARLAELDVQLPPVDDAKYSVGLGVEARVNGYYVHVGSERFLQQGGIRVGHAAGDRSAIEERGCSCLWVAVDGAVAGMVAYEDRIRAESGAVISALHAMGIRETIMLTGDNSRVAAAVGRRLGLSRQIAEMLPADKAAVIQDLQRSGRRVAMVGDGINDSPALGFADVGIAMRHGPDITHEAADIVLMEDSLWKLAKAVEISRDAVSLVKQNYGIVAVMNTLALGLALPGGLISPIVTALLSNGSAVMASLNGIRPLLYR
ncbi:MAG TPA: heavy metal translocating P-type ATPase [Stellaceae bacterium]|nr:heavy metal translocating P-type ATPase [Stellaceae bacterium]